MKQTPFIAIIALGAILSACSSIFYNAVKPVSVITEPPGASCDFTRAGIKIGTIATTPGTLVISGQKTPIMAVCRLPGFQNTLKTIEAHRGGEFLSGLLAEDILKKTGASSLVGYDEDAAYSYDPVVRIIMAPGSYGPPRSLRERRHSSP